METLKTIFGKLVTSARNIASGIWHALKRGATKVKSALTSFVRGQMVAADGQVDLSRTLVRVVAPVTIASVILAVTVTLALYDPPAARRLLATYIPRLLQLVPALRETVEFGRGLLLAAWATLLTALVIWPRAALRLALAWWAGVEEEPRQVVTATVLPVSMPSPNTPTPATVSA